MTEWPLGPVQLLDAVDTVTACFRTWLELRIATGLQMTPDWEGETTCDNRTWIIKDLYTVFPIITF